MRKLNGLPGWRQQGGPSSTGACGLGTDGTGQVCCHGAHTNYTTSNGTPQQGVYLHSFVQLLKRPETKDNRIISLRATMGK